MSIDNPTTALDRALGAEERANIRVCEMEDHVAQLKGQTGVLIELLRDALLVIEADIRCECDDMESLRALRNQICGALQWFIGEQVAA